MYLERITLYGFKTFRKETELLLSPKVTCIVGPNGSGKSNIVDGIRWALGEHRLSFLRASTMEDLIFSGSAFKKPVSVASVKLTFNNEDRTFPMVNTPRVSIERRIYRSKESGYYLNGNPIRLQDVMKVFYSAGIFNHMYAIVSQGKVDEILLAKPEQKKSLIEQVAGVAVFKKRKREALKKLNETEQNLLRVKDLLTELRKRANKVISESKKAHIYYFLNDRLKQLESVLLNYSLSSLNKSILLLESGLNDLESEISELNEKLSTREAAVSELNKRKEDLQKAMDNLREEKEDLRVEEARLVEKQSRLEEQKRMLENIIDENSREVEKIERTLQYIDGEYKNNLSEKSRLEKALSEEKSQLSVLQAEFEKIQKEIAPLIEKEKKVKAELSELRGARVKKEKQLSSVDAEVAHIKDKINEIQLLVKKAEGMQIEDVNKLEDELNKIRKEIEKLDSEKTGLSEELTLAKYKISELNAFISRHLPGKRQYKKGMLGSLVRVENVAEKVQSELENFVLDNLSEIKNKRSGGFFIKSNIVELKTESNEFVKPVMAKSSFLQGIYEADSLEHAFEFFKENVEKIFIKKIITGDGFVLFSPFEVHINTGILVNEKKKELATLLERKKQIEQKIASIDRLMRDRRDALRQIENRLRIAKEKLRERDAALSKKSLLDAFKKELLKKQQDREALQSEIQTLLEDIKNLESSSETNNYREKANSLSKEIYNEKLRIKDLEFKLKQIDMDIKRSADRKNGLSKRKELLKKEIEEAEGKLKEMETNILKNENALNKIKLDLADMEKKEKALKDEMFKLSNDFKSYNVEIARLNEQKENLFRKMENQKVRLAEKKTKVQSLREQMKEKGIKESGISYKVDERKIRLEIASVKAKINELGAIDFTSVGEEESIKEELEKKESVYKDVLSSKKELEKFIDELDRKAKEEFEKTLSGVEKYFSRFFRRMFKGGEATVERILDEMSGEVKGIELNVRLPGKRKQSLPLLSGGEKSLTALAFLFAIFKVKPAPFYVLDEVDAALDEENVLKFSELLSEESSFAQFIVITHNKETMQRADMLYGITMQEDGISKAVSLKLV